MNRIPVSGWDMHVVRQRARLLGPLKHVYDAQEAEQRCRVEFKEHVQRVLRFVSGLVGRDRTRRLAAASLPAVLVASAYLASMPRPPLVDNRILIGTTLLLALAVFYTTGWVIEMARRYEDGAEIIPSRWIKAAIKTRALGADIDAWKSHASELFAVDYRDHLDDLQVLLDHINNVKTPDRQYLLIWFFIFMHMSLELSNAERRPRSRFVVPGMFIDD